MEDTELLAPPEDYEMTLAVIQAAQSAAGYAAESLAPNTLKSYGVFWKMFCKWCTKNHLVALPALPQTVCYYLAAMADSHKSWSTIQVTLCAIQKAHLVKGLPKPRDSMLVKETLQGIARRIGTRSEGVAALCPDDLRAMFKTFPEGENWRIRNIRNTAMLLMGFAGSMRRSEVVDLNVNDVKFVKEGMTVLIKRSKTDQTGEGFVKAIPFGEFEDTCPVRTLKVWLELDCDCQGDALQEAPLFAAVSPDGFTVLLETRLDPRTVANVVQASVKRAGLDGRYAGHSLRAGLVTTAARAGKPLHSIMNQTGHTSVQMVMRYIREQQKFENNAAEGIGL